MPHPETLPPGIGGHQALIPLSAQPAPRRARGRFAPQVRSVIQRVWGPHPISVASALALGDAYGRGINGSRGTISTGASSNGAGAAADPAAGFTGYATPAQLFAGWNPAAQTHVGTIIRPFAPGLPSSATPKASPLDSAMAAITAGHQ